MKLLFLALATCLVSADRKGDKIGKLPGLDFTPEFDQYSGYLDANGRKLHYWFVESQNDPAKDPVVLWLNGGPGCSSLDGFLSEHGPFLANEDGKSLSSNPNAWNTITNMIYLEAPAGVGYSYTPGATSYHTDDIQTADDNYMALIAFFEMFPELLENEFYISGESYGGIYVPTLTKRVLEGNMAGINPALNLKGFLIGNGLLSYANNDNSLVPFAYYHGLVGDSEYSAALKACPHGNYENPSTACQAAVGEIMKIVYQIGLNFYGLYSDCLNTPSDSVNPRMLKSLENLYHGYRTPALRERVFKMAKQSALQRQRQRLQQDNGSGNETGRSEMNLKSNVPCIDTLGPMVYLGRDDVREALHIHPGLRPWSICTGESDSPGLQYDRTYNNSIQFFPMIMASGVRGLVYNGDTDMACNYLGDQWSVEQLNPTTVKQRRPWTYDGQVAGFVTEYAILETALTYLTVKGAGHMVPQVGIGKPAEALHMLKSFLDETPY